MKKTTAYTKALSFVLAVMMLFSVVSVSAFAADYTFDYDFADDTMTDVYVSEFKGTVPADGTVEIPDTLDGYPVVGIGEQAFSNLSGLKKVIIPEVSGFYIDGDAFKGCTYKVEIEVRSNNDENDAEEDTEFDPSTWYEDHKQDFVISGTTLISYKGTDAVVAVPYNCTAIADDAFRNNTYIKTVYIEKEIVSIGANAFSGCTSLENVIVGNGVADIYVGKNAFENTPWLNNYSGTFVILGTTLVKYNGSEGYVTIPNVVTRISDGAFYSGNETSNIVFKVKVPVSVETIDGDCFYLYDSASKVYPQILVYAGSAAEDYCKKAGLAYEYAFVPGDANGDGVVTAMDARYVLRVSAKIEEAPADKELFAVADVSGNGKIAAEDARIILRMAAKLEGYSAEDFHSMPKTDYEVLLTATKALSYAQAYGCAYSKIEYQSMDLSKMNTNTKTYFNQFKNELTSQSSAQTVTYNQDSQEALDNLFAISLVDSSKIKDYSCVINDGYYEIKIVLKDETVKSSDVDAVTFTEKMFPVEKVAHFTDNIKGKYWSGNVDFDMTYADCTLEMKVEIGTMKLYSVNLSMNYDLAVSGKILGIAVSGDGDHATARRTDTVKYTNFVYFAK